MREISSLRLASIIESAANITWWIRHHSREI